MLRKLAIPLLIWSVISCPAFAQESWPFPMRVIKDLGPDGLRLEYSADRATWLSHADTVRCLDVPMGPGKAVDLLLKRVDLAPLDGVVHVDGRPVPPQTARIDLSLWKGSVVGEPNSDVFLTFSTVGSRGWIRRDGGLVHLLAERSPERDRGPVHRRRARAGDGARTARCASAPR